VSGRPHPPRRPSPRSGEGGDRARQGAVDKVSTRALGREAEDLAAEWLAGRGYRILARNHALRRGEVDIVCEAEGVLCFVEVRSRTGDAQGGPEETVDRRKARRVVLAAADWAERNSDGGRDVRFDVVAVTFGEGEPRIAHFPAAFDADGGPGVF
jgi:putative endonuclease